MGDQQELPLPPAACSSGVVINGCCVLRAHDEHRVVVVSGLPVHHYSAEDAVAEAYAMVLLVDGGYATQREVAVAFKCTARTVRRHQVRYANGGLAALATRSGWRPGRRRIPTKRVRIVERLKAQGLSNREIARRLGVTEKAIRKLVGPAPPEAEQQLALGNPPATTSEASRLPSGAPVVAGASSSSVTQESQGDCQHSLNTTTSGPEPQPMHIDVDTGNRVGDRVLACIGLLDDAQPAFGNHKSVIGAGVLCAVPMLVRSGIFASAKRLYGEIGPAFYGLRTTLLTLQLLALWRIKRVEGLKEHDPQSLGRVLGLDRAPEIKTVRRKLTRLASYGRAEQLGRELARLRVQERGPLMGFLYVDGHVRVYHGQHNIPKVYATRLRLAVPGTTDYWVHDKSGDPLFVLTVPANTGLAKTLPKLLGEVRTFLGKRRVTIVFDRGGFSPKLFRMLLAQNFDILTYRKGKGRRIHPRRFVLRKKRIDGRVISYRLHDQPVRFLKGTLRLRQITRLCDDGEHQTAVLTSRFDLQDIELAYRMFERWRQENFFKYMREEFLLDALCDYRVEPDEPTRTVPNPQRRALDKKIRLARTQLQQLEHAYGVAAADNPEGRRPTMRGFKIANAKIGKELRAVRNTIKTLVARRRKLPQRVEVKDLGHDALFRLATERKHLTNLVKMIAFQAESDLMALLEPLYARNDDEGRTLLHELFRTPADIEPKDSELRLTIHPLSSPHRTLAAKALCNALNELAIPFPGSKLRLRFAVHERPQVGLAFPGPKPPTPPGRRRKADTSHKG
jgi:DNA-binding CsgD family transcriptional regulator